jgi:hypothetical protein
MPEADSSTVDYIRWLSMKVVGLPKMFAGVNENFISIVVEGALVMVEESVDLDALQDVATERGTDICPAGRVVQRDAHTVSKKWWCSFGYDYLLSAIRTKLREVIADV